ncbi:MAG TPA: hypothetical protein VFV38_45310 [Ktedonobacteraceae bacterium]|nr:hypothetical protein [Ktedonobacteraceae bacterium]
MSQLASTKCFSRLYTGSFRHTEPPGATLDPAAACWDRSTMQRLACGCGEATEFIP